MTPEIYGIVAALLFSAFFSGMEIAFVSANKLRFELDIKKNSLSGYILNIINKDSEQFISTLLVGNIIALVVYAILIVRLISPIAAQWTDMSLLNILFQTIAATALLLVTGEFLPKTIVRINPNFAVRFFAIPLYIIYITLYPVSKFTSFISSLLVRISGINNSSDGRPRVFGKADLDFFIQQSIDESLDNSPMDTEVKIFQNALDFSNVRLRDCIVPRPEIVAVEWNDSLSALMSLFIETGLSKIIVYKDNLDNVTGYIHSSEMFTKPEDWHTKINQIPVVPETMAASKLMRILMNQKKSIAVVVDEFGGTAGVVTLEDLVEEIFGEIEDEHDTKIFINKKTGEKEYILSGRIETDTVNEMYNLGIPESESYATIAGYILQHHKKFPLLNETVRIDKFEFKILKISSTRIDLVKLKVE